MPIKGVSDVVRLTRLGKIRLGVKRENADGSFDPVPTDYLVCPDEVKQVFGEKPKELRIMFPTDDDSQWASQYYRFYSDSGILLCRGDGNTALGRIETIDWERSSNMKTIAKMLEIPCNPDTCPCYQERYCRRVMSLQFLLPDCPGLGVYQLDTGSIHSIIAINSSIKLIRAICGRLAMIPLSLKLVEQDVMVEGKKETVWILNLSSPCSLAEIQKFAMIPPHQVLVLPPPDYEIPYDILPGEKAPPDTSLANHEDARNLEELWLKVKSKVFQLDVRHHQIANWFHRNYNLDVSLSDFFLVKPPPQITFTPLDHFLKALERQAEHI
jgi:hypothetical protein